MSELKTILLAEDNPKDVELTLKLYLFNLKHVMSKRRCRGNEFLNTKVSICSENEPGSGFIRY